MKWFKNSFLKAPFLVPRLPNEHILRLAITKDSLRALIYRFDRTVAWQTSPSGEYWWHRDIFTVSYPKTSYILSKVTLLGEDSLSIEYSCFYDKYSEVATSRTLEMKRITEQEFIESRSK